MNTGQGFALGDKSIFDLLNIPFDGLTLFFEQVGKLVLGHKYRHQWLAHGLRASFVFSKDNRLIGFRLTRDLSLFKKVSFADTLHSIELGYPDQWNELYAAVQKGLPADLPFTFYWHKASKRACRQDEGEIFTLGPEHVVAVQKAIDKINGSGQG